MRTYFHYQVNGKIISRRLPLKNDKPPKTKRLRKKMFWFYCVECKQWLKGYRVGKGTLKNGKNMCTICIGKKIDLIQKNKVQKG